MTRYLAALTLSFVLLATPQYAAAEAAEAVIGGRSAQIELPDGYCAMSAFDPDDARLVEFLTEVNRGTNTVHLAFANASSRRYGATATAMSFPITAISRPKQNLIIRQST